MAKSGGLTRDMFDPAASAFVSELEVSSGNQANAVATATLPAVAGRTNWLAGFDVTFSGATAAAVVLVTVTGPTNALSFVLTVPAGATTAGAPLQVRLPRPVPAAAVNTAIVVTVPALGAGNTNCVVNAYGFLN